MWKVLIADDEINICRMIQKLISWEKFDMQVVGLVHNGPDALEQIRELKPDIVISDIRMPGCDGLEIVQKTYELGIATDFIIISGYKHFEYAHKALNLGVEHYLLKPISREELEDVLGKVANKKQKEQLRVDETDRLLEQVHIGKKQMRKHFISSIIQKKEEYGKRELDLEQINQDYQCEFRDGCFMAFFVKVDCEQKAQELSGMLHMLEELIETNMCDGENEYINSVMKSGVVTVVNYESESFANIEHIITRMFSLMKWEMDKFCGYHLTLGVGQKKETITEIADSIREATEAVKCRCKAGTDKVIWYERLRYHVVPIKEIVDEKQERSMENIIEVLDSYAFYQECQKVVNKICEMPLYSPLSVYEYLEHLMEMVLQGMQKNHMDDRQLEQIETELQKTMDIYTDMGEMTYQFCLVVRCWFELLLDERKNRGNLAVRQARQYVQDNFQRQITLEEVAEAIHMNPSYLSHMFKKELHINFSDFLLSCRIDAGKELLRNTDAQIAEVAEQIGYQDSKYFSKVFSRVVGLKPSVYRKLYQR